MSSISEMERDRLSIQCPREGDVLVTEEEISEYYFKSAKMWKVILSMEKSSKPLNKSPYNYTDR
jgi:hypothetical protein